MRRWRIAVGCLGLVGCAAAPRPTASVPTPVDGRSIAEPVEAPVFVSALSPDLTPWITKPIPPPLFYEPFDQLNRSRWREIEVNGRTQYTIEADGSSSSLKAHSHAAASILLTLFRFDPDAYPWLSWRWRIGHPVADEDLTQQGTSDAAARVYVYFNTPGLPWQKRNIDYVWSAHLPIGTVLDSAFSAHSKILVVDSGLDSAADWRLMSRNLVEDYQRCFGEPPPDVVAIGMMTDTDSMQTEAIAYYDDVMVTHEPPRPRAQDDGAHTHNG